MPTIQFTHLIRSPKLWAGLTISVLTLAFACNTHARAKIRAELEYGPVLYDYYQENYFSALVEFEYALAKANKTAKAAPAQVLKGGMLLSYGVGDDAYDIFDSLLAANESKATTNRAWYYLAKFYYSKSDWEKATSSIANITGVVPDDINLQYHYLSSLVRIDANDLGAAQKTMDLLSEEKSFYPYLLFNMAIGYLRSGDLTSAVSNLERVAAYTGSSEELLTLADRAKHGLSQLSVQAGNFSQAWTYLRGIQTTGLYSNRALLTYAWSAIKLKRYNDAMPALQILNKRSISIPEVQEAKVLLSHLYEQEGSERKALKANLLAEKEYKNGMAQVLSARKIIDTNHVPKEFISNLKAIVGDSEWSGEQSSVSYKKLTPFLIDLMASTAFNEIFNELKDLYAIQNNLRHWSSQMDQHTLILKGSYNRSLNKELRKGFERSVDLRSRLTDQSQELRLHTLTLGVSDQKRFKAMLEATSKELTILDDKIAQLNKIKPYKPPAGIDKLVDRQHRKLKRKLKTTEQYIAVLEPMVRKLVHAELDKHEERMKYYWAQSRLAKARLYDTTLMVLDAAREENKESKE